MFGKKRLQKILETGDGSKSAPYVVKQVKDEYRVLKYLGKRSVSQFLVNINGFPHDLLECTDGTEIWFDVSNTPIWRGKTMETLDDASDGE